MLMVMTALVMAAMMVAMAMPAFAFHVDGHIGGETPDDKECNPSGSSCNGGYGGLLPSGCNTETGVCTTDPQGAGSHYIYDPVTGDQTSAGGGGGQSEGTSGGGGYNCDTDGATGEGSCVGGSGGSYLRPTTQ